MQQRNANLWLKRFFWVREMWLDFQLKQLIDKTHAHAAQTFIVLVQTMFIGF